MADAPESTAAAVAAARRGGWDAELAEALARHANDLVLRGQLGEARDELDEAAAIHRRLGRNFDNARCLQLAASLCRLAGELEGARQRAQAALEAAGQRSPAAVSALAELGEIALAEKQPQAAVASYSQALELGRALGPNVPAEAALLRRRAAAHALARHQASAAADLEEALALLEPGADAATACRVSVELATACQDGGDEARAAAVIDATWPLAEQIDDQAALADLALLRAAQALGRRDAAAALAHAAGAREHALAGRAPQAYIAAALTLAQLGETNGDRAAAYAALATGWATLANLLGAELARRAFQPALAGLRQRWGAEVFDKVKQDYEARRRRATEEGTT